MGIDDGAVQRHRLQLEMDDLLPLLPLEHHDGVDEGAQHGDHALPHPGTGAPGDYCMCFPMHVTVGLCRGN